MRYYPVPFSAEEEEKLIFDYSTKEVLVFGGGIVTGLICAKILSLILATYMLYCLPMLIPFGGIGAVLAFKKVVHGDAVLTVGDYLLAKYKYKKRPRHYLKGWREEKI